MPHNLLKMPHFFFSDIVCTYAIQIFGIQMIKASYTFLLFNFPFECFVRPSLYYKFPHQKIISHFYSESPTSLPAPGSFRPSGPCHPPPQPPDLKVWLTGRKSELADMSGQQSKFSDPMSKVFKGKSKANLCLTELGDSLPVICVVLSGISETVPLFLLITSSPCWMWITVTIWTNWRSGSY